MTRRRTPETALKKTVKDVLDACGIFHYHLLQGVGSYRGLPDRQAFFKGQVWMLELKAPGKKLSPTQVAFKSECLAAGIPYLLVRSIEDLVTGMGLPIKL